MTISAILASVDDVQSLPEPGFPRQWSTDQHLAASVIDALAHVRHAIVQVHSKKTIPPPKPITRPGMPAVARQRLTPGQREQIRRRNHGN